MKATPEEARAAREFADKVSAKLECFECIREFNKQILRVQVGRDWEIQRGIRNLGYANYEDFNADYLRWEAGSH